MVPGLRNISVIITIYKTRIMGVLVVWVVMNIQVPNSGNSSKSIIAYPNASCLNDSSVVIVIDRYTFYLDYCTKIIKLNKWIIIVSGVVAHI